MLTELLKKFTNLTPTGKNIIGVLAILTTISTGLTAINFLSGVSLRPAFAYELDSLTDKQIELEIQLLENSRSLEMLLKQNLEIERERYRMEGVPVPPFIINGIQMHDAKINDINIDIQLLKRSLTD